MRPTEDTDKAADMELARLGETLDGPASACTLDAAALARLTKSCAQDARDDCIRAALGFWRGCGTAVDTAKARLLLEKACQSESVVACELQAKVMLSEAQPDLEAAAQLLEHTCDAGYRRACGDLGLVLVGRMTAASARTIERGISLVQGACTTRYPAFCPALAALVAQRNLSRHFDATITSLRQSCSFGHLDSCYALATSLEDGTLGVRDYHAAADIAARACERGNLPACNALGYMFVQGHGFDASPLRAAALFYHACSDGYAPACDSTAEALEKGWGFLPDHQKAVEYYKYACSLGSEHACRQVPMRNDGSEKQLAPAPPLGTAEPKRNGL